MLQTHTRQKTFHRTRIVMYYYPILTRKAAAFVTCRAVKKWGNARPYSKSRKKSEERRCKNRKKKMLGRILKVVKKVRRSVVRTLLRRLWLFRNGKTRLLFGRVWNAVIKWKWRTEKKVRSYSDNGTLSPLVHCSTDRWTIAYGTQLTAFSIWKYFW